MSDMYQRAERRIDRAIMWFVIACCIGVYGIFLLSFPTETLFMSGMIALGYGLIAFSDFMGNVEKLSRAEKHNYRLADTIKCYPKTAKVMSWLGKTYIKK